MAFLDSVTLADPVALTRALCDIESVSGNEQEIADAVEAALRTTTHLDVQRFGNTIAARTNLGREQRVVLAGHLDTVCAVLDSDTVVMHPAVAYTLTAHTISPRADGMRMSRRGLSLRQRLRPWASTGCT